MIFGEFVVFVLCEEVLEKLSFKDLVDYCYIGKKVLGFDVLDMVQGKLVYGMDVCLLGMVYVLIECLLMIVGKVKGFDLVLVMVVCGVQKVIVFDVCLQLMNINVSVVVIVDLIWNVMQGCKVFEIEWDNGGKMFESSEDYCVKFEVFVDGEGNVVCSEGDWVVVCDGVVKVYEVCYYGFYLVYVLMELFVVIVFVKDGKCEFWVLMQDFQIVRQCVVVVFDMLFENVIVNIMFFGGGFGCKFKLDFIIEVVSFVQQFEGMLVKFVWLCEDEVKYGFYCVQNMQKLQVVVDVDGKFVGWCYYMVFLMIILMFMVGVKDLNLFEVGMGVINLLYEVLNVQVEVSGFIFDLCIGWLCLVCNIFYVYVVNCFMDELVEDVGKDLVEY